MKAKALALSFALFISACTTTPTVIDRAEYIGPVVPKGLFDCADLPPNPLPGDDGSQANVADWVPQVIAAHSDCKSKLGAAGVILHGKEVK